MDHLAKDLSPEQRLAIESLLGRAIAEREVVTILAFEPPPPVSEERREQIVEGLEAYFARIDAAQKPVSAEESQEAFEEAMRHSRPHYREHR